MQSMPASNIPYVKIFRWLKKEWYAEFWNPQNSNSHNILEHAKNPPPSSIQLHFGDWIHHFNVKPIAILQADL